MTFLEKLKEMYPERTAAQLDADVAMLCPADLGLEYACPETCPNMNDGNAAAWLEACAACWNRQMEGGT